VQDGSGAWGDSRRTGSRGRGGAGSRARVEIPTHGIAG